MAFIEQQRFKALMWLDAIQGDIQDLVVHNHLFWEIQDVIQANEQLANTPSVFYEWLAEVFANSTVLGVRRQLDLVNDSISIHRLMTLLRDHPKILDRSFYVSLYTQAPYDQKRASRTFSRYAGEGADTFSSEYFEKDIEQLKVKTGVLHHYADRRIAHHDARDLKYSQPRFDELTAAIELLERLTIKYLALLKAEVWPGLLPTFQYDWKRIFRIAWLDASRVSSGVDEE